VTGLLTIRDTDNTNIFVVQLLSSYPQNGGKEVANWLCKTLEPRRLGSFQINDIVILDAICGAAGTPVPPASFEGTAAPNTALDDFTTAVSKLLAYEIAAIANTTGELTQMCHAAAYYSTDALGTTIPGIVKTTLCEFTQPLTANDVSAAIREHSSCAFATILENASEVDGWKRWLCTALDSDTMSTLAGLDGRLVQQQVCSP